MAKMSSNQVQALAAILSVFVAGVAVWVSISAINATNRNTSTTTCDSAINVARSLIGNEIIKEVGIPDALDHVVTTCTVSGIKRLERQLNEYLKRRCDGKLSKLAEDKKTKLTSDDTCEYVAQKDWLPSNKSTTEE